VDVVEDGTYEFTARFKPRDQQVKVECSLNGSTVTAHAGPNEGVVVVGRTRVRKGLGRVQAEFFTDTTTPFGANLVEIRRV
jgi:hypothetical protein